MAIFNLLALERLLAGLVIGMLMLFVAGESEAGGLRRAGQAPIDQRAPRMLRIGLATFSGVPALTADDQLLGRGAAPPRCARGSAGVGRPRRAMDGAGRAGAPLLLGLPPAAQSSSWPGWSGWSGEGVKVWNPPALVRWNAHKSYLRDLEAADAAVLPTAWLSRATPADLHALLEVRGWREAVVKPAVSASAHGTWRTSLDRAREDQPRLDELLSHAEVLVQPLAPEVARDGEWSFDLLRRRVQPRRAQAPAPRATSACRRNWAGARPPWSRRRRCWPRPAP